MGRELKRVPIKFSWPLNEVWKGFVNPWWKYRSQCVLCQGNGYAPHARDLHDQWYGNAPFAPQKPLEASEPLIFERAKFNVRMGQKYEGIGGGSLLDILAGMEAERLTGLWNQCWSHHLDEDDVAALLSADRLWNFTRTPRTQEHVEIVERKLADGGNSWLPESNGYIPTPNEVNLWSLSGLGHDSINCMVCVKAKAKRLGYPLWCNPCEGEGDHWESEIYQAAYDAWEREEPPAGEGWQMWETVSEGSPVSPVFPTAEEFENWLIGQGYSEGAVEQFTKVGWAPSAVMKGGRMTTGIEALNVEIA